jgi:hypothetical protein
MQIVATVKVRVSSYLFVHVHKSPYATEHEFNATPSIG